MKRLKIGLFIDSFFPNVDGVVMVVDNLAKCLSKYADVTVVAPDTSSKKDDINRPYKVVRIKSIHVPTTEYRLAMPLFSSKKELQDFDIIHIHSSFTIGKLGVKLAKKQNIPVIGTMHTRFYFEFKKYLKFNFLVKLGIKIIIKPYNKCDECIAVNNALVQVFKDYGLTKEAKVMYNATDMDILKQPKKSINKLNAKYNIDEDETVFLFTGRIISIKNVFFILDTLKILKDKGIKFKMFYVGTGPDEEVLKRKIKEYNMTDEVILTGRITDRELLKAFYYRAKLFLFPSLFDASSLVQIEAASQ
ncbi:MAG: glycosyltransferase, partial [Bacilli bacterium]|nr:glycosyltransferase [Bacilli bacterium]